ncbi:MAG: B-box zinc finger protein [Dehalococcoidia bacterium]
MQCSNHPDREAVGVCVECSNAVCPECKVEYDGKIFCNSCIEKKVGAGTCVTAQPASAVYENTSGMGRGAAVPAGLGEWNWGGFLLTWIWGIGNKVRLSFLFFVPFLGWSVIPFVLAFKGNEWAWQNKRWESVEHFKRVQHLWTMWGWGLTIAGTVFIVIIAVLIVGLLLLAIQQRGTG